MLFIRSSTVAILVANYDSGSVLGSYLISVCNLPITWVSIYLIKRKMQRPLNFHESGKVLPNLVKLLPDLQVQLFWHL